MDIDLLLFGHILYEMATGMELLAPQPEEGVLEMLTPKLLMFFKPFSTIRIRYRNLQRKRKIAWILMMLRRSKSNTSVSSA
ncbi:hypothetical protein AM588_10010919 [Phytophthora nicotianae]|uniref:Uncharacterized protein n=1 Tax=Phytophthora nicotianae TaxID=4792 RepID=A0A0W8DTA5_PHYNI|nr:hypothetical protein AM588_10010919 [Phytophthora nicotianae]